MTEFVRGKNVVLAEYNSDLDIWVVYGCARDCNLTITREFIETSVTDSGEWETILPSKLSFTGNISGLVNIGGTNIISLADLRAKQIAGDKLLIRFARTSNGGEIYNEQGYVYIASSSDNSPHDGMNSFTVDFRGTGELTQDFTTTEILANVNRFQYTGVGGETFFTDVKDINGSPISLIGKTILGFEKDGVGFSKMITSGTPTDKQFKFTSASGRIDVAIPFEAGEEAHGYYR